MSLSDKLALESPIEIRPSQQKYLLKIWNELQEYRRKVEPRITELTARFNDALVHVMEDLNVPTDGSYRLHDSGAAFVYDAPQDGRPVLIKSGSGITAAPEPPSEEPVENQPA